MAMGAFIGTIASRVPPHASASRVVAAATGAGRARRMRPSGVTMRRMPNADGFACEVVTAEIE